MARCALDRVVAAPLVLVHAGVGAGEDVDQHDGAVGRAGRPRDEPVLVPDIALVVRDRLHIAKVPGAVGELELGVGGGEEDEGILIGHVCGFKQLYRRDASDLVASIQRDNVTRSS